MAATQIVAGAGAGSGRDCGLSRWCFGKLNAFAAFGNSGGVASEPHNTLAVQQHSPNMSGS